MRRRGALVLWPAAAVAVALLAACARPGPAGPAGTAGPVTENTVIDGWSIGPAGACSEPGRCEELVEAATDALEARDPGHPTIDSATFHQEGLYPDDNGVLGQIFRSGAGGFVGVVLFDLSDGSHRAIGVGQLPPHLGERPYTYPLGPERRPGRSDPNATPVPTI